MGHSLSADKRERQNLKRAHKNRGNRNELRRQMKKVEADVKTGTDPKATLSAGFKALDRAARKNAIPKKRASRLKARLALALNRAKAGAAKK
ncbi:MAG TPA: 30S ribosomal protein S20 [Planctomycetota bacterium]|nr:30S ribosomal protein S20 [Planctomycetota bacterium]